MYVNVLMYASHARKQDSNKTLASSLDEPEGQTSFQSEIFCSDVLPASAVSTYTIRGSPTRTKLGSGSGNVPVAASFTWQSCAAMLT